MKHTDSKHVEVLRVSMSAGRVYDEFDAPSRGRFPADNAPLSGSVMRPAFPPHRPATIEPPVPGWARRRREEVIGMARERHKDDVTERRSAVFRESTVGKETLQIAWQRWNRFLEEWPRAEVRRQYSGERKLQPHGRAQGAPMANIKECWPDRTPRPKPPTASLPLAG